MAVDVEIKVGRMMEPSRLAGKTTAALAAGQSVAWLGRESPMIEAQELIEAGRNGRPWRHFFLPAPHGRRLCIWHPAPTAVPAYGFWVRRYG